MTTAKEKAQHKMNEKRCIDCIHIEVCNIYKSNVKECRELNISFQVSTIGDVCEHYHKRLLP